ncbi:histidine phosphatase family protein [archaeon]|jgi:broad specificity phosphatase PhoE|nr:histidine phosphatase family protein [archaeon]MBT6761942.1 histidine phosphatase family protein [archaeon]
MEKKRLYLCRHAHYAKTEHFPTGVITALGFSQANTLGTYLKSALQVDPAESVILCSSMSRSYLTGLAVASSLGFPFEKSRLIEDDRLIEQRKPSQEYIKGVVLPSLEEQLRRHSGSTMVAILHGNINKGIFEHLGTKVQGIMSNCAVYALDYTVQGSFIDREFYRAPQDMLNDLNQIAVK